MDWKLLVTMKQLETMWVQNTSTYCAEYCTVHDREEVKKEDMVMNERK